MSIRLVSVCEHGAGPVPSQQAGPDWRMISSGPQPPPNTIRCPRAIIFHLSSQALGFQMLARGRSCSKQEQYAAVTNYALPSPSPRTHRAFFFFFFQLPSTVLLLSTNSVSLGIVWSIWQKCGGPQSETDNVISNWMSQSLVSSGRLRWPELQCESCKRRHLCGPSINISMTFYFWQKALVT